MTSDSNTNATSAPLDSTEASPSPEPPPPTRGFDSQTTPAPNARIPAHIHAPAGASIYPPAAAVSAALNPRSCVTCRRRKVRCDKHMPCGNCRRVQISCVFPAPGRAPRRPRPKDPNAPPKQHPSEREVELVKRLRKLEGIVEELSGQIELEGARHSSTDAHSPETNGDGDRQRALRPDIPQAPGSHGNVALAGPSDNLTVGPGTGGQAGAGPQNPSYGGLEKAPTGLNKDFGRLVLNDKGSSVYVSSGFWSKINDELNELRAATQNLSDEDADESDIESNNVSVEEQLFDHQSFILGYRSADVDLRPLHPLPSQIPFMWQMYQEKVDPVLKIFHVPSMNQLIRESVANLDGLTPSIEALMFSIYYAVVTSMDADEVSHALGAEKSFLLNQYRFAVEQALAKANFITDPDFTVCQALVMFLVLVRRHDKNRFSWTLTGLAVRICQAIGLHRDGTNFPHLKPFEIEMRRRLFWSLVMLDLRSAEDQGTECIITDGSFDTQFPLNIDDADISPDSEDFPPPRERPTDVTFCLLRFEICSLARKMHQASSKVAPDTTREDTLRMLDERETILLDVYHRIEAKYLRDDPAGENAMHWVAGTIARVIVAKMITIIYQPILFCLPVDPLSCRRRERLFTAAIEIFEYNYILNTDPRCKQWRWLFQTYTSWHAVAYLLLEMCNRTWSATSERAWAAINACFSGTQSLALEKMAEHTALWMPFKKLYHRAKKHRDTELARLRAHPEAAERLNLLNRQRESFSTFGTVSSSTKVSTAEERWRKLVNLPPIPEPLPSGLIRGGLDHPYEINALTQPQSASTGSGDHGNVNLPLSDNQLEDKHLDELVGAAITNPRFDPRYIYPLAFHGQNANVDPLSVARNMVFGFSPVDMPAADAGLAPVAPEVQAATQSPMREFDDNDRPPWLWNISPVHKVNEACEVPAEDHDVNMDEFPEGFDWQNWQQSARGFELEANGNGGSVWGEWYGL